MKKIIYTLLLLVAVSCDNTIDKKNTTEEAPITYASNKTTQNVLYSEASNYSKVFDLKSPIIGYSSFQPNVLAKEQLSVYTPDNLVEGNQLKSADINSFTITVNGQDLKQQSSILKSASLDGSDEMMASWYGNDVQFVFKSKTMLKSGQINEEQDTVEMYIPELVSILSPEIQTREELLPYCYYDGFVLEWTEDPRNMNGLVVMTEWNGNIAGEKETTNKYIRNIDILPEDNGTAVLNNALFDEMPQDALVHLTLLRGNIDIAEIDGFSYRVLGENHEVLSLILVRDLDN